jgi:hypothetical protein
MRKRIAITALNKDRTEFPQAGTKMPRTRCPEKVACGALGTQMHEKLTRIAALSPDNDEHEFWLSNPEPMGEGKWGFSVFVDKDVRLATFTYQSRRAAERGRLAIPPVICEALYISTGENP